MLRQLHMYRHSNSKKGLAGGGDCSTTGMDMNAQSTQTGRVSRLRWKHCMVPSCTRDFTLCWLMTYRRGANRSLAMCWPGKEAERIWPYTLFHQRELQSWWASFHCWDIHRVTSYLSLRVESDYTVVLFPATSFSRKSFSELWSVSSHYLLPIRYLFLGISLVDVIVIYSLIFIQLIY